eukprot:TRINITY_DN2050_c1_g1_i1.p1 TRINITY_DN2050_c1_g1~~TRINITY_DN2050_c1_g1_i1.p1  ORF type:complete len:380 (-),score=115.01 TRINITY_DN2050_c1_g1_i1:235-1374(-)
MKDWNTEDMKKMILNLPLVPIDVNNNNSNNINNNSDENSNSIQVEENSKGVESKNSKEEENGVAEGGATRSEEGVEEEIDYFHPSAFWGYLSRAEQLDKVEESINRLTYNIPAAGGGFKEDGTREDPKGYLLQLPYKPLGYSWLPDELGALIGRLLGEEWELDYITYLLVDLATIHLAGGARHYRWEDYMGYVGIILSSAMAVQRHWENEDIVWVYKDFCIDVGRWALHTWPNFREMEYREWLADIIVLVANRRGDESHDTKLINSIMEETCEDWNYEKSDYLGFMIEKRMQRRSFPYKQIDTFLSAAGIKKQIPPPVHNRSFLWSPGETYYISSKWEEQNRKLEEQKYFKTEQQQQQQSNNNNTFLEEGNNKKINNDL